MRYEIQHAYRVWVSHTLYILIAYILVYSARRLLTRRSCRRRRTSGNDASQSAASIRNAPSTPKRDKRFYLQRHKD